MRLHAVCFVSAALGAAATQRVWADRLSEGSGAAIVSDVQAWDAMQSGSWLARDVAFQPGLTNTGRTLREIVWHELGVAEGADQTQAIAAKKAVVDGKTYNTEYVVIARSGFKPQGSPGRFGQLVDEHGKGLTGPEETYPDGGVAGENWISNNNDFSSLLPRGDDDVYIVTHFESPEPEVVYFSKAKQDLATGELTMVETEAMDWSEYGGIWTPCAGSVTPWQSHLGSEEYEPDAREWADNLTNKTATGEEWRDTVGGDWNRYFKLPDNATNEEMAEVMFPYSYGYPWEVQVGDAGDVTLKTKHMAAGRLAIELPYVMPDNKTVYVTDDGDNVMLMMYKASAVEDLSCGTIYGAKFTQLSAKNGGEFDIEWIEVGAEACSDYFKPKAESTTFYDLFDTKEPDTEAGPDGDLCPEHYTTINAQPGGLECLKLKPGKELLASRFETRRLAAMKGVTTEWSKWEGITLDTKRYQIYTALSEVRRGMEDFGDEGEASEEYDLGTPNAVQLPWNPCGCVYTIDLNDEWEATKMSGLVCGTKVGDVDEENACALDGISSPDNVAYVAHHDALLIAEDTSFHVNNVMWYYDLAPAPAERELVRIYSVPLQAEVCGPYHFPNIRGWEYIQAVAQHPLDDIEENDFQEAQEDTGTASYLGYIGPFKSRPESVDMAGGAPKDGRLWNDFPVSGKKGAGIGGGDGGSAPAKKPHKKDQKHHKNGHKHGKKHHKKGAKEHDKKGAKAHDKKGEKKLHGDMRKYHKLPPGTSRQRSAEHHSEAARRWAGASHAAHRAQRQHRG